MMPDWKDIPGDSKDKYQLYLCSREWSEKKNAVRRRCNGVCERCFWDGMESVHHLTYQRKYAESLDDLQALCKDCHEFIHGKTDADPRAENLARVTADLIAIFLDGSILSNSASESNPSSNWLITGNARKDALLVGHKFGRSSFIFSLNKKQLSGFISILRDHLDRMN